MNPSEDYSIGTPGVAWGEREKATWLSLQTEKRLYAQQVEARIKALEDTFHVEGYGELNYPGRHYKLYAVMSQNWRPELPAILITGGVHGYETSGVMGALRFLETLSAPHAEAFNFLVLPCVSPWAFETINRWNCLALDPNRSFVPNRATNESAAVMDYLTSRSLSFLAHFDLHETTDTDNTEFRPALAARDAIAQARWDIPDGFFTVADTSRPAPAFQKAIIRSVEKVTHVAPPTDGKLIGEVLQQHGVICNDAKGLGLCMGLTDAPYVTTTEVYPDSPLVTDDDCMNAQVAAVAGGLGYLMDVS